MGGGDGDDVFQVGDTGATGIFLDGQAGSDTYTVSFGLAVADIYVTDSGPTPTPDANFDVLDVPNGSAEPAAFTYTVGSKTVHYDDTIEQTVHSTMSPFVTITGSAGPDSIMVDGVTLIINGTLVDLTHAVTLDIQGLGGDDTIQIVSLLDTITSVTVDGGDGNDTIVGPDHDATWHITGANQGDLAGADVLTFTGVENITGGDGADTFLPSGDTAVLNGVVDGGGGNDVLDFSARTTGVTVDLDAGTASGFGGLVGMETVIGSPAVDTLRGANTGNTWGITGADAGNVDGTLGFLGFENIVGGTGDDTFLVAALGSISGLIDGGAGNDTLVFTMTDGPDAVTVAAGLVTRNGVETSYQDIDTLTVSTLGGADSVTVTGSATGMPATLNIWAGDDDDTITVFLATGMAMTINVDGGAPSASDNLAVVGTTDTDAIAVDDLAVTSGATMISLTGIENLTVDGAGGDDAIELSGTGVTGSTALIGGSGDDTITLNHPIQVGSVAVDGGGDAGDSLVINATIIDAPVTVTLSPIEVQVVGGTTAGYTGFALLTLNTGAAADSITILDTAAGTTTVVNAGANDDTIIVQGTEDRLTVNAGDGSDTIEVQAIGAPGSHQSRGRTEHHRRGSRAPATGSTLAGIADVLSITSTEGSDTVRVDDTGDVTGRTGTLTDGTLTGLGMPGSISYSNVTTLLIGLGSGSDTFIIADTHSGQTRVSAGDGADTIVVNAVSGPTIIDAGTGLDVITVNLTHAVGSVQVASPFNAALVVNGGDDADTLNVYSGGAGQHGYPDRYAAHRPRDDGGHHLHGGGAAQRGAGIGQRHLQYPDYRQLGVGKRGRRG